MGVYEGPVTTSVRGVASDFAELATAKDPAATLINGRLELRGDSAPLIELQKNSPNRVRVVYVVKGLYENYKDFLNTTYESFRRQQSKLPWMKEL